MIFSNRDHMSHLGKKKKKNDIYISYVYLENCISED